MVHRNIPGEDTGSLNRFKESKNKEDVGTSESRQSKQETRSSSKEILPFNVEFEEGPEDLEKLDVFLLSVSKEKMEDPEAVENFMRNMIQKESEEIDRYMEKLEDSDSYALQNLLVNQRYFLDRVESSLESKSYKNRKSSPIVDWINAKRRFYQRKMEKASEVTKPAHKDVIKRLETIGRTLIIDREV